MIIELKGIIFLVIVVGIIYLGVKEACKKNKKGGGGGSSSNNNYEPPSDNTQG